MSTAVTSDRELLAECWNSGPSLREDGPALFHLLSASTLLCDSAGSTTQEEASHGDSEGKDSCREDSCRELLKHLIGLFRAERAILIEVKQAPQRGESRLGRAIASSDLDGEPIHQPERKVPADVLERAVESRQPTLGPEDGESTVASEARPPSLSPPAGAAAGNRHIVFPVEHGGECRAVLFVENRFQPLDVARESLRTACACARLLGCSLAWQQVCQENASLWADAQRLREASAAAQSTTAAGSVARDSARHSRRSELKGDYSAIIGSSACMLEIFNVIDRISGSNAPILINGESGTGKELIAHAVHENSPRHGKVFVSENCGALTETLLESELFGYVKGAFTGAGKDHKGLFELAEEGTLFLDEVGDMSPGMQKKLLRVLQEGVIRRVGGKDYIPVNVRIISATNKDLMEEVKVGNFREDLYYRLNVINIRVPPLRERKEDIPELIETFLAELARETGTKKNIEPAAVQRLVQHNWPGNVRELRNEIKRIFALSEGDIGVHDLSEAIIAGENTDATFHALGSEIFHLTLREATERLEKEMIRNAIVQSRGNKSLVAKMLQVPKTSLYNKINRYGLDRL